MITLTLARAAGYNTATIGKLGPALIMDHTDRGQTAIAIDDSTGKPPGVPLLQTVQDALKAAGLGIEAPVRGANGVAVNARSAGTLTANVSQQAYFAAATTGVVLPAFKQQGRPFLLVFWSRDPDGTQHNQGDNLLQLRPGINGPTSLAAVRNVDNNLAAIVSSLQSLGLEATTDVIVTADHGFSTISKESATSAAAKDAYAEVPAGLLIRAAGSMTIGNRDSSIPFSYTTGSGEPIGYAIDICKEGGHQAQAEHAGVEGRVSDGDLARPSTSWSQKGSSRPL